MSTEYWKGANYWFLGDGLSLSKSMCVFIPFMNKLESAGKFEVKSAQSSYKETGPCSIEFEREGIRYKLWYSQKTDTYKLYLPNYRVHTYKGSDVIDKLCSKIVDKS